MDPDDVPSSSANSAGASGDPLDRLAAAARGWHRIQLAVLGFIGFCGALWAGGDPSGPQWLQWLASALAVLALAIACAAIYVVGRVAFPVEAAARGSTAAADRTRRLRAGILLTYLAVGVLVVATLSGWWPKADAGSAVEVQDATGKAWCGEIVDGPVGAVALDTSEGSVTLTVDRIAVVRPVAEC